MAQETGSPLLPSVLPPEYSDQISQLQQQQALAQALFGRAIGPQPTEQISGIAVKQGMLGNIARALTAGLGQQQITQAQTGQHAVQRQFMDAQQQAIQQMQQIPDIGQRIAAGESSQFPRVQEIAKALRDQHGKSLEAGIKVLGDVDPSAAIGAARTGMLPGNFQNPVMPDPKFSFQTGPDGKNIPTVINTDKNGVKTGHLGGGTNISIDNVGENAARKALGGKVPDVVEGSRNEAQAALDQIQNSHEILKLVQDPAVLTGFGANYALGFQNLAAKLGFQGSDGPAKTQELITKLAQQTIAVAKQLPGAISDKEGPFLKAVAGGQIEYTPEALKHLAELAIATNHNRLMAAREQYNGATKVPGAEAAAQMYPFPSINYTLPGDGKQYTEMPGTRGRLRYDGGGYTGKMNPVMPVTPGATPSPGPAPNQEPLTVDQLTPAQKAMLLKKLQGG